MAMILEAAINGARMPSEHSRLPIHPDQIAESAARAVEAGAGAVHFHVRARDGRESLASEDVARCVAAVRSACRAPIGISTGAWIEPDPDRRLGLVLAWRVRPDFASVNFDETGAAELAMALLGLGVAVEAGLATAGAAERLMETDLAVRLLRVLLEPQEKEVPAALDTVAAMEGVLSRLDGTTPRLLHGTAATTWPLLAEAVRRGYDRRIGLEDTLVLPDGTIAADNEELIKAARGRP